MSHPPPQSEARNFFSTLFDIEFRSFITLRFAKAIYIVGLVLILLGGVLGLLVGLFTGGWLSRLAALVLVPLGTLLYIIMLRLVLEALVMFFRIGHNTTTLVRAMGPYQEGFGERPHGGQHAEPPGEPDAVRQTPPEDPADRWRDATPPPPPPAGDPPAQGSAPPDGEGDARG